MQFKRLGDGLPSLKPAGGDLVVNPALTALTPLFNADELGPGLGEGKRADPRRLFKTVHCRINR